MLLLYILQHTVQHTVKLMSYIFRCIFRIHMFCSDLQLVGWVPEWSPLTTLSVRHIRVRCVWDWTYLVCLRSPSSSSSWSSSSTRSTCSSSRSRSALEYLSHVTVQKVCVSAKWGNELVCKVHLSCLVPAGEHALRDDPGFPSQHPAPPGHLWPPDDSAAAADPVQARLVTKLAERLQTRLLPLQYIWINTQYILTIRVLYRIRIERRGSKEVTLLPDIQTQSHTASQNRDSRGVTAGISRGHFFPIFLSHYRFSSQNKCWIRKWGSYFSALCAHPYRCSPVSCPVTHNWQ